MSTIITAYRYTAPNEPEFRRFATYVGFLIQSNVALNPAKLQLTVYLDWDGICEPSEEISLDLQNLGEFYEDPERQFTIEKLQDATDIIANIADLDKQNSAYKHSIESINTTISNAQRRLASARQEDDRVKEMLDTISVELSDIFKTHSPA
jgi:hypothetical protein